MPCPHATDPSPSIPSFEMTSRVPYAPDQRGAVLAAVKMPSLSETFRSASRTALVMASRCRLSWILSGGMPISSLWSTPTVQVTLRSRGKLR